MALLWNGHGLTSRFQIPPLPRRGRGGQGVRGECSLVQLSNEAGQRLPLTPDPSPPSGERGVRKQESHFLPASSFPLLPSVHHQKLSATGSKTTPPGLVARPGGSTHRERRSVCLTPSSIATPRPTSAAIPVASGFRRVAFAIDRVPRFSSAIRGPFPPHVAAPGTFGSSFPPTWARR